MPQPAPKFTGLGDRSHLLGEGPRWFDNALWWIDIEAGELWRSDGLHEGACILKLPHQIGSFAIAGPDTFVLATRIGFEVFERSSGRVSLLTNPQPSAETRFNDGRVDAAGRFWAGTMALDPTRYGDPMGVLYRLDGDGKVSEQVSGLTISNGIDWSNDSSVMYLNDTMRGTVWAFDFDLAKGTLANKRIFAALGDGDGLPDGLVVDADDHVWIAAIGGGKLIRFKPDGTIDTVIQTGTTWPTALTFGGDDLSTLYVTTSRHLMREDGKEADAGILLTSRSWWKGRPENRMRLNR